MDVHKAVINKLNQIQRRENLSEADLARKLGVDPATIWRWKKGQVGRSVTVLLPLFIESQKKSKSK